MTTMSETKGVLLTKEDLRKVLHRYLWVRQSPFNYETMQSGGWVWAIDPAMQKIYDGDADILEEKYEEHFKFFNSHPWMNNVIMGACLAIESTKDENATETAINLRTGLMGPLAGLGDSLIWVLAKNIMSAIAAYDALDGNIIGMLMAFIVQWLIWSIFYVGFFKSYDVGITFITDRRAQLDHLTEAAQILGLAVIGCMVASTVNVKFGLNFTVGELERNLDDLLNSIFPHFGNIVTVVLVYLGLNRKGMTSVRMLLIVLVVSMFLSFIKFLA